MKVKKSEVIGFVSDPVTLKKNDIITPLSGVVIDQARDQVVHAEFAIVHIAQETSTENIEKLPPEPKDELSAEENDG